MLRVPDTGVCYFWGVPTRRIKIGASSHPDIRLRTLRYQFCLPSVGYLAVVDGGGAVEREYHARFAAHRHGKSDWCDPHPDILAEIERINALSTPHAGRLGCLTM